MKRSVVLAVGLASLGAAAVLVWAHVRQEREFRHLVAAGEAALSEGLAVEATEAFSGALAFKSDSMLAYLRRGEAYRLRGDFTAALRDLRDAEALDATAPRPVEVRGDVYAAMGDHASAIDQYERYLALDDRAAQVLYKLALAHFNRGEPAEAVDPLGRALTLDAQLPQAHYLLGMVRLALNQRRAAMESIVRAVALDGTLIPAREELARMYEQAGRWSEAIGQLEAVAALDAGRSERLVALGLMYAHIGRHDAAIVTLSRAAERYPRSTVVYTALGRVWLDMGEAAGDTAAVRKALEALAPVAARADARSETLALYGRALMLSGSPAGAERVLQRAVTRAPVDPAAYRFLAEAARGLGHRALAVDADARYAALAGTS